MNKSRFSATLKRELRGMPRAEIAKTVAYYEEMIDDKIEGGMTEEQATASLGDPKEIARSICAEGSAAAKPKTHSSLAPWAVVLLVLGSPLWVGLAAGALGLLVGFFAVVFSLGVAFFAVLAAMLAGGAAELLKAAFLVGRGGWQTVVSIGAGLLLLGVGLLLVALVKPAAAGLWRLAKLPVSGVKKLSGGKLK